MSESSNDWIGRVLSGGRYRVDAKLGEGGMGFVYKVWDRNLDSDVVIKVPRRSMLDDPEFSRRFALEIRSLVKLTHPNIVKVSDVGEHQGLPFAVMQYLPGGTLDERQAYGPDGRPRPAAPGSLASWLPGMASALDFIHRNHHIHRDVKPANILFDKDGHPYLSDFGVAKVISHVEASAKRSAALTGIGIVLGTPEYMAPELIMGDQFDGRVDQYALAATAYEILCGRTPFAGDTPTAILVRQTTQEPPPMVELPSAGSGAIARVILQGLAKKPDQRFANCAEFASAMLVALAKVEARPAIDRLTCPSCAAGFAIPADLASFKGKKSKCRACGVLFRFADDGLGLILVDPASAPTPSGSIDLATAGLPPTPARVARTVKLEASGSYDLASPAAPRAGRTVKLDAMANDPAPEAVARPRPNPTRKVEAMPGPARPASVGSPPASRTRKIGAIPARPVPVAGDIPESTGPPSSRDEPAAGPFPLALTVGGGGLAALVLAGVALALLSKQAAVRPIPPLATNAGSLSSADPTIAPNYSLTSTSTKAANDATSSPTTPGVAAAPPSSPPAMRPPAEPKSRASQPAAREESPGPVSPRDMALAEDGPVETPGKPASDVVVADEPPDADLERPDTKAAPNRDGVTLKQVIGDPANYLGGIVSPSELITVDTRTVDASGPFEGLTIKSADGAYQQARNAGSPFEIVVTPGLGSRVRDQVAEGHLATRAYPAILKFKVEKNPNKPNSFLGVVESLEFLVYIDPRPISFSSTLYNKAFKVVIVTENGPEPGFSRSYEDWKKKLGPTKILVALRQDYQKQFKANRDANFNRMFDQAAREVAATNRFIQQQQQQQNAMLRQLWGR